MDIKGNPISVTSTYTIPPISEDSIVYIAVKGSLYAHDCTAFGLGEEEIKALTKKYPGSGSDVVNGVNFKTNVIDVINSLAQLGYKVIASTGETEVTWTMQRDI